MESSSVVNRYNEVVKVKRGLQGDFAVVYKTEYDGENPVRFGLTKHGDFVGTNCRISTYALLKNKITIPD